MPAVGSGRRMARQALGLGLAAALVVFLAGAGRAAGHPHIWIEHLVTVMMGAGGVEGVRLRCSAA